MRKSWGTTSSTGARASQLPGPHQEARAVLDGLPSKDIASRLNLSVRTVENHRARIMEKLRVNSAMELMRDFMLPAISR